VLDTGAADTVRIGRVSGIKSILLHVDAMTESVVRLELTRRLASRLDSRITALFAASRDTEHTSYAYSAGAILAALESEWDQSLCDEAKRRLQLAGVGEGPPVAWCDVVGDSITHGFLEEAAYADLLVIGQQVESPPTGAAPAGFVEATILQSGRPTLVIPRTPRTGTVGQRVLVAWDGSAQAARALTNAIPFLERAEQVHVVSWAERARTAPFSRVDVRDYLRDHYISATLHLRHPTSRIAEQLATLAASLDADLVVMGCYGHSRIGERIFGGASRAALTSLHIPILMAH
jgi:nucleotide-binding universal stress UspA family protein